MKNYRKLTLGLAFLACATFIVYVGIGAGSDLLGLSTVIGAIAAGVFGLIWGNVQEHAAKNGNPT